MKRGIIGLLAVIAIVVGIIGLSKSCGKTKVSKKISRKYKCVDTTCEKIKSCARAKYLFEECGLEKLDKDNDGIPCENLCKD